MLDHQCVHQILQALDGPKRRTRTTSDMRRHCLLEAHLRVVRLSAQKAASDDSKPGDIVEVLA